MERKNARDMTYRDLANMTATYRSEANFKKAFPSYSALYDMVISYASLGERGIPVSYAGLVNELRALGYTEHDLRDAGWYNYDISQVIDRLMSKDLEALVNSI